MVFNTTFNNVSVISWWSVLLMEETGENHQPAASHWQNYAHANYENISIHILFSYWWTIHIYRLKYTISTDIFILAIKKWHGLVKI